MNLQGYVYVGKELIEKVSEITDKDYETKGDMANLDMIIEMVKDLVAEYNEKTYELEEELESEKEIRNNYYKPKSHKEIEGVPEFGPID